VASLNSEYGSGIGKNLGIGDEASSTQEGGDTKVLNDTGCGESGREVTEGVAKVELAPAKRLLAKRADGGLESLDVVGLINHGVRNLLLEQLCAGEAGICDV